MLDEPPVAEIHQGLHRTAGSDPLLEGDPFGVMKVQQGDPVEAQPFHRLLDRGTDPIAGKVPGPRIRVDLGREHDVGRQSTGVSDRRSDPALGGAVLAVAVRGVHEGEGTVEGGEDRGDGAILVHGVAVQVGHAGQRTGSEADRRHREPGPPELPWTPPVGHGGCVVRDHDVLSKAESISPLTSLRPSILSIDVDESFAYADRARRCTIADDDRGSLILSGACPAGIVRSSRGSPTVSLVRQRPATSAGHL